MKATKDMENGIISPQTVVALKMKFKKVAQLSIPVLLILIASAAFVLGIRSTTHKSKSDPGTLTPTPFIPKSFVLISQPTTDTTSWNTFVDKKLKFSIKYPTSVILDKRQTVQGILYAFIASEDSTKSLPGKFPILFISDTHTNKLDGFTAFKISDCGKNCQIVPQEVQWVNINNVYGIKNPNPKNTNNYYLTDKKQTGSVINVYVGGATNQSDKTIANKVVIFDQMIKTIQFNR